MTLKAPVQQCPYCGSNKGYYTKVQVHGSSRFICNFDGSEADNGEMYESLTHSGGKSAYCLDCNKQLFKMNELLEVQP